MFGCCVAGRLVQTNLVQVDGTHAYFELPNSSTINHVCVFATAPFPDGYGAAVHFFWPGRGIQLLGMLSNDKPSAIFRARGTYSTSSASAAQDRFSTVSSYPDGVPMQEDEDVTAILGISIEPLNQIQAQIQALPAPLVKPALLKDPTVLAERIVKHLFNYIAGFTGAGGLGPDVLVPMNVIARWYETFLGKVRAGGVGFLERGD